MSINYQNLFQELDIGIIFLDSSGNIFNYNNQANVFLSLFNFPNSNFLIYQPFLDLKLIENIEKCFQGQKSIKIISCLSKENKCFVLKIIFLPVITDNQLEYILIMIENITDYEELKSEVYKKNQILNYLINNIPYQIWLKDIYGKYVIVNKFHADICGYSPNEMIGKTDSELLRHLYPDMVEDINKRDLMALDGPICYDESLTVPGDKTYWFRKSKTPVYDSQNKVIGTVGISIDQTLEVEQKQLIKNHIDKLKELLESNQYIK